MEKGDILYKYRSLNDQNVQHTEELFLRNRIYFPSPDQFNDPFDCRLSFSLHGSGKEWRKYLNRAFKRSRPELSPAERLRKIDRIMNNRAYTRLDPSTIHRMNRELGVLCLSAVRNDILMWSHYAEKHTGFVLEFRAGPTDSFFRRAQRVRYQDEYPKTRVVDSDEERMQTAVLTKSSHWAYEQEYRIIEYESGPGIYTFPEHLLTGVILGCQMPAERKAQVRKWLNQRRAKPIVYEAIKKDREFGLSIEPAP